MLRREEKTTKDPEERPRPDSDLLFTLSQRGGFYPKENQVNRAFQKEHDMILFFVLGEKKLERAGHRVAP